MKKFSVFTRYDDDAKIAISDSDINRIEDRSGGKIAVFVTVDSFNEPPREEEVLVYGTFEQVLADIQRGKIFRTLNALTGGRRRVAFDSFCVTKVEEWEGGGEVSTIWYRAAHGNIRTMDVEGSFDEVMKQLEGEQ